MNDIRSNATIGQGRRGLRQLVSGLFAAFLIVACPPSSVAGARGEATPTPVPPVPGGCPRPVQSGQIQEPPSLSDPSGSLAVSFSFQTATDAAGRTLYCFVTPDGMQNPTLHVSPGGTLTITVTNNTPPGTDPMTLDQPCNDPHMDSSSVNIHYHGTNTSPACGSDQVIQTVVNSGETYQYTLNFPVDEPPGMYWYHPHVHGNSDPHVMGGATGALIVDGIENFFPGLGGLPQHTLVVRDQRQFSNLPEGPANCGNGVPWRDISVNNVPVNSFQISQNIVVFAAGALTVPPSQAQFWRVGNTSADTILDLQLIYDGVVQTFNVVAIDGVPVNSQDGTGPSSTIPLTHFRLPPASRVEFTLVTPSASSASAQLVTSNINTGAQGDCDPRRPLFGIAASTDQARLRASPAGTLRARPLAATAGRRFAGLAAASITAYRTLYFAEDANGMYMTVSPQPNQNFFPNQPPAIITNQGAVEQWVVQNRSTENHEFHIHQIHFLVQSQDNFGSGHPPAPAVVGQYLDMIEVPAWSGVPTDPYPSVTLLMDFRGAVVGRFVFHCHILAHEDAGMMNVIQVNPPNSAALRAHRPAPSTRPRTRQPAPHRH